MEKVQRIIVIKTGIHCNHQVGFVFQSYNLIMHQSVLSNVELALTLTGVNKEEKEKEL